jgi:hypothetical protein
MSGQGSICYLRLERIFPIWEGPSQGAILTTYPADDLDRDPPGLG